MGPGHQEKVVSEQVDRPDWSQKLVMQLRVGEGWRCRFDGVAIFTTTEVEYVSVTEEARQLMPTCLARVGVVELLPSSPKECEPFPEMDRKAGSWRTEELFGDPDPVRN